MSNQDNHWADKARQNDLLLAKLALAATDHPQDIGPCLSDADVKKFFENRLKRPEKDALLRHLNGCAHCYELWCDAMSCRKKQNADVRLTPEQKAKVAELARLMAGPPSMPANIIKFVKIPKKMITGTVTAAACLVVAFFVLLPIDRDILASLLTALMQQYSDHHPPLSQLDFDRILALPRQTEPAYRGLGPASADRPPQISFAAGLWDGRRQLTGAPTTEKLPDHLSSKPYAQGKPNSWLETDHKGYYQLGQWCGLLKVVCTQNPAQISAKLWHGLAQAGEQLLQDFTAADQTNEDAAIAAKKIERILSLLQSNEGGRPTSRQCIAMGNEIDRLVTALGPSD